MPSSTRVWKCTFRLREPPKRCTKVTAPHCGSSIDQRTLGLDVCPKPGEGQPDYVATLTLRGQSHYIRSHMGSSLAMKILTAVAVGAVLLVHLSPVAAGMLLCIGDGSDPDCCRERHDSHESRLDESTQLLDGSDCGCCITVDAAPSTAGAGSHKASLDVVSGSALLRNVASPTETRVPGTPTDAACETGLSSIRSVVLLI